MQLGALILETNLFLSPLAGYTNLPFRRVVREIGGVSLCTTDLVNARSLLEKNHKALKLIETDGLDHPMSVQLFGAVPEEMRDAAVFLEQYGADSVDINMGCPVRKVCQVGGGSKMMTETKKTADLVRGMVEAIKIPVTCKMRLGWDEDNITAPDLARALEDVGVAAIFVHGRTRQQGFDGQVNLSGIRQVVDAVRRIPVIGNGDITTPQAAKQMLEETGCAGVSIGRGAFYNPWIFQHILAYLKTGEVPPEPAFEERVRVMTRHLDLMVSIFGEAQGCRMFRKVGPWYAKRFGPSSVFNRGVVQLQTRAAYDELLKSYREWRQQFVDEAGNLLPKFQPPPMATGYATPEPGDIAVAARQALPVPSGPNELW